MSEEKEGQFKNLPRTAEGRFVKGVSGNPAGRPKGSKNKITLLKLAAEEAVREDNLDKMIQVCAKIVEQALEGDTSSQKMVWDAMVSKGIGKDESAKSESGIRIDVARVEVSKPQNYIDVESEEIK